MLISLERFVWDTVEQVRRLAGVGATDPELAGISISSVTISFPCDWGDEPLPHPPERPLRLAELRRYLKSNDRSIVVNRDRLRDRPSGRLTRVELTVHF